MATVVQSSTGVRYKDDPAPVADDRHRPTSYHPGRTPPQSVHHSGLGQNHSSQPRRSPPQSNGSIPQGAYPSPHTLNNGLPLQQHPQSQYPAPPQQESYYTTQPSPYNTTGASYPSSEAADLMASTAHMQRPTYPPMYHTPQSNSPASVASPQTHDQHGRMGYGPPHMAQNMYGYPQYPPMNQPPMNQVHPSPYATHPAPQSHQLTSQSMMMSHPANTAPLPHQAPATHPSHHSSAMNNSPRLKIEPHPQPQQQRQQQSQQAPPQSRTPMSATHPAPPTPTSAHSSVPPGSTGNPNNAAPGPIPATTPLVVRQDGNGVQWIAFEYSRDRVKMEYTIRCDVESVNVDDLTQDFRTDNCVYPRACCNKDQYRGNRLQYETECNTVGWALAQLNPILRSKRGLIQRAVDSWRNSNQDPRLRSRRVRRMAKTNTRKSVGASQPPPNHMAGPNGPGSAGGPGGMVAPPAPRPQGSISMGSNSQLHHHHAHNDGPGAGEDMSGEGNYTHRPPPEVHNNGVRQAQVFQGYPAYPNPPTPNSASMAPPVHSGMNQMSRQQPNATAVSTSVDARENEETRNPALYPSLPEAKRRKFIIIHDDQKNSRIRVKVTLDDVKLNEIPDSYRKANSVFPRTYYPVQMQQAPDHARGRRFSTAADHEAAAEDDAEVTIGRTLVPVPSLGENEEMAVPKLTRARKAKEEKLNDLAYCMSWHQSRVFAGRTLFLQRCLDMYRNKTYSALAESGYEETAVPRHLKTRMGKQGWKARDSRRARGSSPQTS